jgi:hypothetical protein
MPDTEAVDVPRSGINPDLQLPLNSGKRTHYPERAALDSPRTVGNIAPFPILLP